MEHRISENMLRDINASEMDRKKLKLSKLR
jgi:hypothetical protein